jgi:excisionase family DNA binding protein
VAATDERAITITPAPLFSKQGGIMTFYESPFYTPREAAEVVGASETTILRWLRAGRIEGKRVDRYWYVMRKPFDEFAATYSKADVYKLRGAGPGIVIESKPAEDKREVARQMIRKQRQALGYL